MTTLFTPGRRTTVGFGNARFRCQGWRGRAISGLPRPIVDHYGGLSVGAFRVQPEVSVDSPAASRNA